MQNQLKSYTYRYTRSVCTLLAPNSLPYSYLLVSHVWYRRTPTPPLNLRYTTNLV